MAQSPSVYAWQLWAAGQAFATIELATPLLATWEANDHPAQKRMRAYLAEISSALADVEFLTEQFFPHMDSGPFYLHLDVDVGDPRRLVRHHDLENYLTPVVHHLGHKRFVFVSARKRVDGGSQLTVGRAAPRAHGLDTSAWEHFSHPAGPGAETTRWKAGIREALLASQPAQLPPGPVAVHLAWRCSAARNRNWVNLWKPTGDTMGPVLGPPDGKNPFNPNDDRIVELGLHLNPSPTMAHDVDVAMWWRLLMSEGELQSR